eukprot:1546492-Karenia_brevis.AAC.1
MHQRCRCSRRSFLITLQFWMCITAKRSKPRDQRPVSSFIAKHWSFKKRLEVVVRQLHLHKMGPLERLAAHKAAIKEAARQTRKLIWNNGVSDSHATDLILTSCARALWANDRVFAAFLIATYQTAREHLSIDGQRV